MTNPTISTATAASTTTATTATAPAPKKYPCYRIGCGCHVEAKDAVYPSLATIDEAVQKEHGRLAKVSDLKHFRIHTLHGVPGYSFEFLERTILARQQNTVQPKDRRQIVLDRANSINVRFGLNAEDLQIAVNRSMNGNGKADLYAIMAEIAMRREHEVLAAEVGLMTSDIDRAVAKSLAESIPLKLAMQRLATGQRLAAAKRAKQATKTAEAQLPA